MEYAVLNGCLCCVNTYWLSKSLWYISFMLKGAFLGTVVNNANFQLRKAVGPWVPCGIWLVFHITKSKSTLLAINTAYVFTVTLKDTSA